MTGVSDSEETGGSCRLFSVYSETGSRRLSQSHDIRALTAAPSPTDNGDDNDVGDVVDVVVD